MIRMALLWDSLLFQALAWKAQGRKSTPSCTSWAIMNSFSRERSSKDPDRTASVTMLKFGHSMIGGVGVEVGSKAASKGSSKRAGQELFKQSALNIIFQQEAWGKSAEPSAD